MRLFVLVEGQTEEELIKRVIGPHLMGHGVWAYPIIVTTRRDRATRKKLGKGGGHWKHWSRDLHTLAVEHRGNDVRFTTLFDLYGLPSDYPELSAHAAVIDTVERAALLEQAMADAVGDWRLIPYLQRHEFEALVLAGIDALEKLIDPVDRPGLTALRGALAGMSPEDVNDSTESAPSKRLATSVPSYQKTVHGPLVVESVGLESLRRKCPRFNSWLTKLEGLKDPAPRQ
jgi:hypothetical protein